MPESFLARVFGVAAAVPLGVAAGFAVCYSYAVARGLACLVLRVPTPTEGIDAIAVVIVFMGVGLFALPVIVLGAGWAVAWRAFGAAMAVAAGFGVVQTSRRAYRYHRWHQDRDRAG